MYHDVLSLQAERSVNVIVPGNIDTDFRRFMDDETRELNCDVVGHVEPSRPGTMDEVAAVALFLLSDAAYVKASR